MLKGSIRIDRDVQLTLTEFNEPYYLVLLTEGEASFSVDFNAYRCEGQNILFLSPYQLLKLQPKGITHVSILRFHGDFYCIEYHKEEVACNGLLFNNIYERPYISTPNPLYQEIDGILQRMVPFENAHSRFDTAIARSYLQLILALCSREKIRQRTLPNPASPALILGKPDFNQMLDKHFIQSRSVRFYADLYHLSVDAFSKKIKKRYGKSPSALIKERVVLEAKKLLHLTHKTIREIAAELGFEDEFYFSRFFKKTVGVAPAMFRDKVGISIVAEKSMQNP